RSAIITPWFVRSLVKDILRISVHPKSKNTDSVCEPKWSSINSKSNGVMKTESTYLFKSGQFA
ncbi:MAG: hypothetical protein ACRD4W_12490, partial [Nitrososphaeraceae archaeon]